MGLSKLQRQTVLNVRRNLNHLRHRGHFPRIRWRRDPNRQATITCGRIGLLRMPQPEQHLLLYIGKQNRRGAYFIGIGIKTFHFDLELHARFIALILDRDRPIDRLTGR